MDLKKAIGERIKDIRVKQELSGGAFGEAIGMSRAGVSAIEGGKNYPSIETLIKIEEKFGVDVNWLLTNNPTPATHPQHIEPENMITDPLIIKEFRNGTGKRHELQAIPLYDVTAAAGLSALHNSSQHILDYMSIPNLAKCDGAIYLKGDSMYPLLKHGDIVAFQKITDIPDDIYFGEMYIVDLSTAHREKIVCKYVQKSDKGPEYIKLVSYNEKHHPAKDVHISKVRAMAEVKASIRLT